MTPRCHGVDHVLSGGTTHVAPLPMSEDRVRAMSRTGPSTSHAQTDLRDSS